MNPIERDNLEWGIVLIVFGIIAIALIIGSAF